VLAAIILSAGLRESKGSSNVRIDWGGAFLLVTAIISLLITPVLHENAGYAWQSPFLIGLLVLGALLLVLFTFVESKAKEPILPLHLFRNRTFVVISFIVFTLMLGVMGAAASFQLFAQNVLGMTPIESGYLTLPLMIGGILSSVVAGRMMTKVPYRSIFIVSMILPAIAFYLMTGIDAHTKIIAIICYFVILGLGFGILFNNNLIVQESVPKEHSGVALSTVTLFQSIGMTIGQSVYGSLLASQISSGVRGLAGKLPPGSTGALAQADKGGIPKGLAPNLVEQIKMVFSSAFQHLYWVSFVMAIVVFVICWFLKSEVVSAATAKEKEKATLEVMES
jgi:MFS family permease